MKEVCFELGLSALSDRAVQELLQCLHTKRNEWLALKKSHTMYLNEQCVLRIFKPNMFPFDDSFDEVCDLQARRGHFIQSAAHRLQLTGCTNLSPSLLARSRRPPLSMPWRGSLGPHLEAVECGNRL